MGMMMDSRASDLFKAHGLPGELAESYLSRFTGIEPIKGGMSGDRLYALDAGEERFCLRHYRRTQFLMGTTDLDAKVRYEQALLRHLVGRGFKKIIPPVSTLDGEDLVEIRGELYGLFEWVPIGESTPRRASGPKPAEVGKLLGRFHDALTGFDGDRKGVEGGLYAPIDLRLEKAREVLAGITGTGEAEREVVAGVDVGRLAQIAESAAFRSREADLAVVVGAAMDRLAYNAHNDFTPQNIVRAEGRRGFLVVDFSLAGPGLPVFDLFLALRRFTDFRWRRIRALLTAYRAVHRPLQAEVSNFSLLFEAQFLSVVALILREIIAGDVEGEEKQGARAYVMARRKKFLGRIGEEVALFEQFRSEGIGERVEAFFMEEP